MPGVMGSAPAQAVCTLAHPCHTTTLVWASPTAPISFYACLFLGVAFIALWVKYRLATDVRE